MKFWIKFGNEVVGGRTIDVHIRKLEKKLRRFFKTIKGVGYKFEA
jgi:two-component system alkaline phosphatase synthesis response regulator PhoP